MHAALASSLASIVLTAASSARAHARRGSVLWPTVAWMVPGLLLGAWLGSGVAVGTCRRSRSSMTGVAIESSRIWRRPRKNTASSMLLMRAERPK